MKKKVKLVSACLLGIECRWDGKSKPNQCLIEKFKNGELIPVCPEQLGGLSTPRMPAEIIKCQCSNMSACNNKVVREDGLDVTDNFIQGAKEALKIAQLVEADEFITASKSPSCGKGRTYDGSFSGKLVEGDGVTAAMFKENGIKVTDINEFMSAHIN